MHSGVNAFSATEIMLHSAEGLQISACYLFQIKFHRCALPLVIGHIYRVARAQRSKKRVT